MYNIYKMSFSKKFFLFMFVFSQFFAGNPVFGVKTNSGLSFQTHNLIFIMMYLYLIFFKKSKNSVSSISRIKIPSSGLLLFFIYTLSISLAFVPVFGINKNIINFLYAVSIVILFYSMYENEDINVAESVIGTAFLCALSLIVVNIILQAQSIISFFVAGGAGHPQVETLAKGSVNYEATFLALYSIFVMKKKYGLHTWYGSFVISILYASRTAFIVNAGVIIWYLVFIKKIRIKWETVLIFLPFVALIMYFTMASPLGEVIIKRFTITGKNDPASLGRIKMWENLWDVIERYPVGVGCGNVALAVKKVSGYDFSGIDNLHNIFLQFTTEEGFIGFLFIFWGSLWLFYREMKIRFQDPFGVFMLLYLVQGALQSRGFDAWMAEILGLYFISRKRNWYGRKKIES